MTLIEKYNSDQKVKLTKSESKVFKIIKNIGNRRGFEFHDIDDDIMQEILEQLIEIVKN